MALYLTWMPLLHPLLHFRWLIPYGRKFWREDTLADCWEYVIWQNLLWRWVSLSHITIFIAKRLIERAGNLTGPWASFRSVRTKSMIKCNSKLNKSLLRLLWTVFVPLVFTVTMYTSFGPPSSGWQTSQLFPSVYKTLWRSDVPVRSFQR